MIQRELYRNTSIGAVASFDGARNVEIAREVNSSSYVLQERLTLHSNSAS